MLETRLGGRPCSYTSVLKSVSSEDAKKIEDWVSDRSISAGVIFRELAKREIILGPSTISKHRRGDCVSCIKGEKK